MSDEGCYGAPPWSTGRVILALSFALFCVIFSVRLRSPLCYFHPGVGAVSSWPLPSRAKVAEATRNLWRNQSLAPCTFLFAVTIALLTGLNSYYFSQPFGTLKDYVGLFLWAAGTKAALDILGMVLDRLIPVRVTTSSAAT